MNTTGKKGNKDFGLAAQLVRPRVQPIIKVQAEEEKDPRISVKSEGSLDQAVAFTANISTLPQRENSDAFSDAFSTGDAPLSAENRSLEEAEGKQIAARASKRPPGRPRRTEKTNRMTLILSEEMAVYLEDAWRIHRRANGKYVNGPSAFIEELLKAHRRTQNLKF